MQVGILKRVLEEVDKVMHEFRGMLYKSMEDPLLDLAEVLSFTETVTLVNYILNFSDSIILLLLSDENFF